jgi:AraC family transcriptional regulator
MRTEGQKIKLLDYKQEQASAPFVPNLPLLSSTGWNSIHLEYHRQPKFETVEHQHTMHVIACSLGNTVAPGKRSLDGKAKAERRSQGDIAIIPAGIAHRCNWNTTAEFAILAIEPQLLQQVGRDLVDCDRISLIPHYMNEQDRLIQGIFSTLKDELESHKIASNLLINSLETTLAIHLLRKYCSTKPKLSSYKNGLTTLKLRQVEEYIHQHLDRNIKVIELTAIAKMSPWHFIRSFKTITGISPHQYVLQQRIKKSQCLLQQDRINISEIAATVGFCDQSHFTKYFKRIVGMTPRQYSRTKLN